ncbi:circularly permuted type 2 ATP-grasp protein [Algibacter sp. L4_22]|uniref:circularly permuted type 2 ATP-grasp protein n=1 Tax=Algibacter sp. L4_22 TaxID=2942477 RepID=UPI00201B90D7|nr:circularly permuted type 2 ATP-grasp protein [Algibacter sp. L4_22]MCL5127949.1 circularly permuted type 2 ATP-grasp protein [Algibacter sp. L4_22]
MTIDSNTLFQNYFTDHKNYDEVLKSNNKINPNWDNLLSNLTKAGPEELISRQKEINWLMDENGVTYNVYNDPKGLHRAWDLSVIPFLIHDKEWQTIEKGLIQRAELLNLILKDIYGKRELIKNGIVPQEVLFAHRGFLRQCDQIQYNTSKNLLIHATDLARGPDGRMWVVNDRTEAPSGLGYALENRFALNKVAPNLFSGINVKQPSGFFQDYNQMLIDAAPKNVANPNIVILTSGPHNETYFEHAYMSSFLGYSLVKGNDLVVRNGKVWMKSLKELKQVHVILRRVDDAYMDPLELREDSYLGIAGILDVIRQKNVSIVNPIGSGVLENSGLIPFMNAISKYFLKEELLLPQIASWWCGQEKERDHVFKNIEKYVVKRIDRSNRESIYFCEFLDEAELNKLKEEILANPYRFVAQDKIKFSTAPDFIKDKLEPRKIMCRTFAIAKKDSYSIMPGGLVRVASEREDLRVSNQRGGVSKDFWIVTDKVQNHFHNYAWDNTFRNQVSDMNDLPSHTAENLFWSGRYLGRTLITSRLLRMCLNKMQSSQFDKSKDPSESLKIIFEAVTNITSTLPGFVGKGKEEVLKNPLKELNSLILDNFKMGSLAQTLGSFNNSYYTLRNLWSKDMWRVFDGIKKLWNKYDKTKEYSVSSLLKLLDSTTTRLIAFMGLIEESILVDQGLLLYFIGLQTEQASLTIEKCRSLIVAKYDEDLEYEMLEALLSSHESLNIYRYSYRSYLSVENVIKLVLLNDKYSRSLTYQLSRILKDIGKLPLPKGITDNSKCYNLIKEANQLISNSKIEQLLELDEHGAIRGNLDDLLSELSELLHQTSLSISDTYFNHSYQQTQLVNQNFPLQ